MGWTDALARLLRPERNLVMRVLEDQPLTVADIVGTPSALRDPAPLDSDGCQPLAWRVPNREEAPMDDARSAVAAAGPTTALHPLPHPAPRPAIESSDLADRVAELPVLRPRHDVEVVDHHRFAQAVCSCGWLGAARRARASARSEADDHALLFRGVDPA